MMLARILPPLAWLPAYRRDDLASDTIAGTVTAIMLVPQAMAYALIAGLPPQVGLYASIAPLVLYALFGSSRALAVGPVAIVSLMVAAALGTAVEAGGADYVRAATTLALLSGATLLLMGALRLGFLVNFMSHQVIAGFTSGAALVIGFNQLKHLLGLDIPRSPYLHEILVQAWQKLAALQPATLVIGLGSVAFLLLARGPLKLWLERLGLPPGFAARLPQAAPLAVVVLATAAVTLFALAAPSGVAIVGAIPAGPPPLALPWIDWKLIETLLPAALLISLVGYLESVSVAKALAAKRRQKVDPNQELIGLGAANLGAAMTGGYPVTGGFSRSVVNFNAGARTPLASVVTAALVLLTVSFLTPLFHDLPKAVLAAIIMVAVFGLVDVRSFLSAWRYDKADAAAMAATFLGVLALGVEPGIMIGIGVSLLLYLWRTTRPHIAVVGRVGASEHFRNMERHAVTTLPHVHAMRIDESLYFANTRALEDHILTAVADDPKLAHVVLICSAINLIDASALEALEALIGELRDAGVTLHLAEVKGPVMDRLKRTDFLDHLKPGRVFLSTHEAMVALDNAPHLTAPRPNAI